jgi:hypothetical protein
MTVFFFPMTRSLDHQITRFWQAFSDYAMSGDSARFCGPLPILLCRLSPPCRHFLAVSLQTRQLREFDPWVTQLFPLRHPPFSTGSPNVFHSVTQGPESVRSAEGRSVRVKLGVQAGECLAER